MPVGDYVAGLAAFAGTWGGAACVAAFVVRRRVPRLDPVARGLALALLFLAALLAAHLLPGLLGILSPLSVTTTAVAAAALASRLPATPTAGEPSPTPAPARPSGRASRALAAMAVLVASVGLVAVLLRLRNQPPIHIDAVSFALPGVAQWMRSGSVWDAGAFVPLYQVRTYPNNGELLDLAAILPWHNDAFLRLVSLPLLGMTGFAVYAVGRELRAPAATAVLLATAVLMTQAVAIPALDHLKPDIFMYATFSAGAAFLVRHARTERDSDLLLAGLGLGLAFGARWYGVSTVVVVAAIWLAALLVARRPPRRVVRAGAVLAAVVLGAGGFWLLRNLALTGNPLYPVRLAPFGFTLLDAPVDRLGFTIVDRLDQPAVLREHVLPGWWAALGPTGLLVVIGGAAALLLAAGRRRRPDGRPLAIGAAALGLAITYLFLPAGSQGLASEPAPGIVEANTRWLVPALLLGAGTTAWAAGLLRRGGLAVDLLAFVAILASAPRLLVASTRDVVLALAVVLVVAVGWLGRDAAARALDRLASRRRAAIIAVSAAGLAAALGVAGHEHQRRYNQLRYADRSPILAWVEANAPAGQRVGVTGYWAPGFVPTYGLFGPRLGNHVGYVGSVEAGQVWPHARAAEFRRALQRGGYGLLVVGRLTNSAGRVQTAGDPPHARWAAAAGFSEVARDRSFVLLARRPATPAARPDQVGARTS